MTHASLRQRGRSPVALYTLGGCVHCERARELLRRRGVPFAEIRGDGDPDFAHALYESTGKLSVPQVAIHGEPIGGADDLVRLDRSGVLLARVSGLPFPRAVVRRRLSAWKTARWIGSAVVGARCTPWRYSVEIVDRDGRTLERHQVDSEAHALLLADALTAGEEAGVPEDPSHSSAS